MKICTRCKSEKSPSEFTRDRQRPDGLKPYCRPCVKEMSHARRIADPDKHREWGRKWRERNPERAKEAARAYRHANKDKTGAAINAWREKNPEKARAYTAKYREKVGNQRVLDDAKRYREANREKSRASALRWQKNNPGKVNAANAARYAAKLRATPKWANLDAIECFYEEAERLKASTGAAYEVDHIVPLRSKIVCGLHCEANLRVIPSFDNRSKGNRTWPDMP